jgi:hypothetical protein
MTSDAGHSHAANGANGADGSNGANGSHAGHGPLAEEAAKLAEAFAGWVSNGLSAPLLAGLGESAECRACPVCQLLRIAQGGHPEVFGHLADASASLLAALRAAVECSLASWPAGRRPVSERIDIR